MRTATAAITRASTAGGRVVAAKPAPQASGASGQLGRAFPDRCRRQRSAGDAALGHLVTGELRDHPAAGHDEDAVAQALELDAVGGQQDDRGPTVSGSSDERVDVDAGPGVDPLGRLLSQQDLRLCQRRPGEHHLLLVAARQRLDRGVRRRRLDRLQLDLLARDRSDVAVLDESELRDPAECLHSDVLADGQRQEDALGVPVPGYVDRSRCRSRRGAAGGDPLA
jgi:hypothetical protein